MLKYFLMLLPVLFWSCGDDAQTNTTEHTMPGAADTLVNESEPGEPAVSTFSYHLDEPDTTFLMPGKLKEISGLSLSSDARFLLANNDEHGKIFFLNKETGEVENDFKFEADGDYEGIEMVGEKVFVVKSSGTIYETEKTGGKEMQTIVHKNFLDSDANVEGLGYDPTSNCLLLACKGKAGKGDEFKHKRAVYAYDLAKGELLETPALLIDREEIQKRVETGDKGLAEKLAEFFDPKLADDAFAPSGIAVHPATNEIYILSSVGKLLVIVSNSGKILHLEPLDPAIFQQPEGICFDQDGTLYISSEGKNGAGKVMRFRQN